VQFCQSRGIHLSAHTPLGVPGGRDSGYASSSEDEVESPAASIVYSRSRSVHAPMLKSSVVGDIAARLGRTPAQVNILSLEFIACKVKSLKWMGSDSFLSLLSDVNVKVLYFVGYSYKVKVALCPVVSSLDYKLDDAVVGYLTGLSPHPEIVFHMY